MSRPAVTLAIAIAATATIVFGNPAHAAPGDLDGTFGNSGVFVGPPQTIIPGEDVRGVALDHLERPVLGAASDAAATRSDFEVAVMRLTTGGVLDPTFNPNGATPGLLITGFQQVGCAEHTADGPIVRALAVTPDHHIVVAADLCQSTAGFAFGLMRIDENGAFDTGFDGDGKLVVTTTPAIVNDLAVDSSERIYAAGLRCAGGGPVGCLSRRGFITRFTKAGVRDVTFAPNATIPGIFELTIPNVSTYINGIQLLPNDEIVAVGSYTAPATFDAFIARISSTGELVTTFGPNGTTPGVVPTDLAKPPAPGSTSIAELFGVTTTDNDQSFVVTGQISALGSPICPIAKFTATGDLDTSFASNGTTPGITGLSAYTCRHLLTQTTGKIVTIGWGPRPVGPGFSDTNQVIVARFEANGQPDASFGVGGLVKTPFSDYALAMDGALQGDGNFVVSGIRRLPNSNTINPVVLRYLGGGSTGPTPTPGNPTPSPTATPLDQPGEICGNCIDDESDSYVDRDDPECGARADGGGQGLDTPKVEGKAIVKCAKAIEGAGAKLGTAKLAHLQRCVHAVFVCRQSKPNDAKCLPKAATTCAKQLDAVAKDRGKAADAITKACAVAELGIDDLKDVIGLGYGAEGGACSDVGVVALDSLADLTECVHARRECAAERLLAFEVPRAAELLVAGGRAPAVETPCLPSADAPAAGLGAADRAKAAVKCQATVEKAASKFAGGEAKAVQSCLQAATACVQLKPGDDGCLSKLRASCAKKIATLAAPGGLAAKLAAAVVKDCGGLDATELGSPEGLGYQALSAECVALGAAAPMSATAIADCLCRQHECRVEQMLEATTPRIQELLRLGQVTLP
jgi:uncharacterized delta-60 repeat protein